MLSCLRTLSLSRPWQEKTLNMVGFIGVRARLVPPRPAPPHECWFSAYKTLHTMDRKGFVYKALLNMES